MDAKHVQPSETPVPFRNHAVRCIGTGRMGLALHQEYMDELRFVQKEIGFEYIRGHGLFSDDMAIYQEYTDAQGAVTAEYNFTYLDRVMDGYRSVGIKPFLELGFMPEKMASDRQTIFYWRGNVTPPKCHEAWRALVTATLSHLLERYGEREVLSWPIEVWNEPNLPGFWKDADMDAYFALFKHTFEAVKAVHPHWMVGGPAICGVDDVRWMTRFMEFCEREHLAVDFISRHHYTSAVPERDGHYAYVSLDNPDRCLASVQATRALVDSRPAFRGMPIHITEFSTSYVPNAPIHDTNYQAAYIANMLARLGDAHESYSYWTFGDVFEEIGVPFTPFHGGFGLVAHGCVPKPVFWAFKFFGALAGECVLRTEDCVLTRGASGAYRGVAWNVGDTPKAISLSLPGNARRALIVREVDEEGCNPLKAWHDMGQPASFTPSQLETLKAVAVPRVTTSVFCGEATLTLRPHAVTGFEVIPAPLTPDRGYDYDRVMRQR